MCKHKHAYRFHESGPMYCPDCNSYVEYKYESGEVVLVQLLSKQKDENQNSRRKTERKILER